MINYKKCVSCFAMAEHEIKGMKMCLYHALIFENGSNGKKC